MGLVINGTEFTTFDDLWKYVDSLSPLEKEEIRGKIIAAGKRLQEQSFTATEFSED